MPINEEFSRNVAHYILQAHAEHWEGFVTFKVAAVSACVTATDYQKLRNAFTNDRKLCQLYSQKWQSTLSPIKALQSCKRP